MPEEFLAKLFAKGNLLRHPNVRTPNAFLKKSRDIIPITPNRLMYGGFAHTITDISMCSFADNSQCRTGSVIKKFESGRCSPPTGWCGSSLTILSRSCVLVPLIDPSY